MRRLRRLLVLAALLAAPGCLQAQGERCQVTSDCVAGYVCSAATQTCETSASGQDGGSHVNARVYPDAMPDAGIDAAPTPDAAPVDAVVPDAT